MIIRISWYQDEKACHSQVGSGIGKQYREQCAKAAIFTILVLGSKGATTGFNGSLKQHRSHHLMEQYLHDQRDTGHPVRSAIHKLEIGRLVVGWVTTSESLLLYVF